MIMNNKDNYKHVKRYIDKKRNEGWKSYTVLGPPDMINQVKQLVRDYKRKHKLYVYDVKTS